MVRIGRWFERNFGLLVLSWLLLISYLQARGISRLVEGALSGNVPRGPRAVRPRIPAARRTADAIIARNPFDSVTVPLARAPAPLASLGSEDPLAAPQCASTAAIIVTEARDPAWSVAALQTAPEIRPRNYRVGDHVAGDVVAFIGFNPAENVPSVWLSGATGLCQSSLFVARPPLPSAKSAAPPAPPSAALSTPFLRHVRVVPELQEGTIVGLRLFGIRSDSLLQLIGLKSGDRLESINGFALGTPAQALSAYAQLRTATRLALNIERRGRPLILAYRID